MKLDAAPGTYDEGSVTPVQVRGLKTGPVASGSLLSSHPVRVRELIGAVVKPSAVAAPRAGAWVETDILVSKYDGVLSHPVRA